MELAPLKSWKAEFARSTDADQYREILRRANEESKKKQDEDKRAEREDDALEALEAVAAIATDAELTAFASSLDSYDTASYEALIENERLLDAAKERLKAMYENAYQLPDGRRVFESEDGVHVFDENGIEISSDMVHPDEIEDWRTSWEAFQAESRAVEVLAEERTDIIEFQGAVDDARQRVEDGDLTKQELEELKTSLEEQMPDRVRELLPEDQRPAIEPDEPEPEQSSEATWRPGVKLDLPTL